MPDDTKVPESDSVFLLNFEHCSVQHQLKFKFDLSLYSHRNIHSFLANGQFYEPGTSQILLQVLRPGDTFIDIGAHIGYFTLLASRLVGPAGRVYSFEPEARNHEMLLTHLRINQMTNVLPFRWAVSSSVGVIELFTDPNNDGGHAIWDLGIRHGPDKVTRQSTFSLPIDHLMRGTAPGSVRAIKIDTEGFELEVLRGMQNLLTQSVVPLVVAEINRDLLRIVGTSEQAIRDFMVTMGYRIFFDDPETGVLSAVEQTQIVETRYVFNLVFIHKSVVVEKKKDE